MTRLQAAIGGLIVAPMVIISIAFGAPEILSLPPSAPAAVAEPRIEVTGAAPADTIADRTSVRPLIFKKTEEQAPVVAPSEAPTAVASATKPSAAAGPSSCERHLYPVVMPKEDGLLDRLVGNKAEQALTVQQKRNALAIKCYRAERGEGR